MVSKPSVGTEWHPPETVLILGALAGSRLAFWTIREAWPRVTAAFVDDTLGVATLPIGGVEYPVVQDWRFERLRDQLNDDLAFRHFVVGSGHPEAKRILVQKALEAGLTPANTIIHPRAHVLGADCVIGKGGVFSPFSLVASGSSIGDYVHLAPNAMIGHDCALGDRVTCNPGSTVAGYCRLGDGVTIGAGAVVRERTMIAAGVTVGAQACVTKDIPDENTVVVGVPAIILRTS